MKTKRTRSKVHKNAPRRLSNRLKPPTGEVNDSKPETDQSLRELKEEGFASELAVKVGSRGVSL